MHLFADTSDIVLNQGKQDISRTPKRRIEQAPQVNRPKNQRKAGDQSNLAAQLILKSRVKQVPGLRSEAEVQCIRTGESQSVQQGMVK